jgi:Skp family chaperone for outer membrane proteins
LAESYRNDKKLDGIIYVHSIMNPRMQGTAYQNLRMFKKMVGSSAMHNVALATSFWDQVDRSTGLQRELELANSEQFWGEMIRKGATTFQLGNRNTNLALLEMMADFKPVTLLAQREMVDQGKAASQTGASRVTAADLEAEKRKHKEALEAMRRDLEAKAQEQKLADEREKERLKREQEEHARRMEEQRQYQERMLQEERQRQEEKRQRLLELKRQLAQDIEYERAFDREIQAACDAELQRQRGSFRHLLRSIITGRPF